MPQLPGRELVAAVLEAVHASGGSAVLISSLSRHPRQFALMRPGGGSELLWVYMWTLTFGGRPSLPNEYRVQMTTVQSPLQLNPAGATVLIGYEPNLRMFAGFDLVKHRTFTPGSSSVQIDLRVVRQALQDGLAFDRKSNDEIAVAFRSDQFLNYVEAAPALHKLGRRPQTLELLRRASSLQVPSQSELEDLPDERRRIVVTLSRFARSGSFRQKVLDAYGNRCAVTGIQLRLVEAAHIVPVGAPGSSDDVRNGLALSPSYHRALDSGLIYIDEGYNAHVNPSRQAFLRSLGLEAGLHDFAGSLGRILLPQDRRQWPSRVCIRRANGFRGIRAGG